MLGRKLVTDIQLQTLLKKLKPLLTLDHLFMMEMIWNQI